MSNSIVVLIKEASEAKALIQLATSFASALEHKLVIAIVNKKGAVESLPLEEVDPEIRTGSILSDSLPLLQSKYEEGISSEVAMLSENNLNEEILELARKSAAKLLLLGYHDYGCLNYQVAEKIFLEANSDLLVVRINPDTAIKKFKNILIPIVGGPHAIAALKCAEQLARDGGMLTLLFIESSANDLYKDVGMRRLESFLKQAGLERGDHIQLRVELANNIGETISKVAEEGFELVLVGSSSVGSIRRTLFGTLSNQLITSSHGPALGVFRKKRPFLVAFRGKFENILDLVIPQLNREERVNLFEEIEIRSKWSFDFFVLMVLSTVIAALGLLQNSAAVVIGAMLVAPLMTPLLGSGLSVLQENSPLFKRSIHAVLYGFVAAFISSALVGLFFSEGTLTAQMLARTSPTMLDILVGLLSGIAAAHCISRPALSAALPGVAIAAALVPPIATSGVAFSIGEYSHTLGSFLLFFTNVIAIVLGSAMSFFAAGVRPKKAEECANRWYLKVTTVLMVLLVALTTLYLTNPSYHSKSLSPEVHAAISKILDSSKATIQKANVVKGALGNPKVLLNIQSPRPLEKTAERKIVSKFQSLIDKKVEVELKTELISKLTS